jgi:uncharacterized membrane protein YsdA (DUF1294 family)
MVEIKLILLYYCIVSIILFILMGVDKLKAVKHKWRIPEKTLFTFGVIGGFVGGFLAMAVFHHKVRKPVFWIVYGLSAVVHIALAIILINKGLYLC